jgi:hypothetical protein
MLDKNYPRIKPRIHEWLASRKGMILLRELQFASGTPKGRDKELGPLRALTLSLNEASGMLSILDKVLKSEL